MTQRRFDVPPSDSFFWCEPDEDPDLPFGREAEERRQRDESQADNEPSWIQALQDKRRRERKEEQEKE